MKILVKVKAGMDAHFKNTVRGYDKSGAAGIMRPDPASPWDYIVENFTACPVEEVGRWQSVEKAANDAPPKPKEFKISNLIPVLDAQNKKEGRRDNFAYRIFIAKEGQKAERAHLRSGENGKCMRVDPKDNDRMNIETLNKYMAKYGDLVLKANGGALATSAKPSKDDNEAIYIYF